MAESKKTITVNLQVKELIYDVQNKTHLAGQAREAGGLGYESASYMQASDDNESAYQIMRSISDAYSELKVRLGEYLNENTTDTDNKIKDAVDSGGVLTLTFQMPSNFHQAAVDSLGAGCHEFIVCRAVADWYTLTNPAETQAYVTLSENALETAKRALYKRARPTRPTYSA